MGGLWLGCEVFQIKQWEADAGRTLHGTWIAFHVSFIGKVKTVQEWSSLLLYLQWYRTAKSLMMIVVTVEANCIG